MCYKREFKAACGFNQDLHDYGRQLRLPVLLTFRFRERWVLCGRLSWFERCDEVRNAAAI